MAQIIGNFKNVEKTVAHRHQRYMCYRMTCTKPFLGTVVSFGPGMHAIIINSYQSLEIILTIITARTTTIQDLTYADVLVAALPNLDFQSVIHR